VLSTLVFPCAQVACELALATAIASVGALGYSQVHNLPLLQLASVTGVYGVSFVVAWFASTVNLVWQRGWSEPGARRGAAAFAVTALAVLVFGLVRLASARTPPLVQVAALAGGRADTPAQLLAMAARELDAGAHVVAWPEVEARIVAAEEPDLVRQATALAARARATLALALLVDHGHGNGNGTPRENVLVFVDATGVRGRYRKVNLSPGEPALPGQGPLAVVPGPELTLGGAICADFSYARFIAHAGRVGVDVMVAPAAEWAGISPVASHYAIFRAVENGFALVKPTRDGTSVIADAYGRVLAQSGAGPPDAAPALRARVPTRGPRTLYGRLGDSFAYAASGLLLILLARARRPWVH
jgi:apolipoprotein N-acyltransferase